MNNKVIKRICLLIPILSDRFHYWTDNQVIIAQWLEWQLATVTGSKPGKGDTLLISD